VTDSTEWTKSAKSANSGECVEMRRHSGHVEIQDTKHRGEGLLTMPRASFAVLLDAARDGELDHLS